MTTMQLAVGIIVAIAVIGLVLLPMKNNGL